MKHSILFFFLSAVCLYAQGYKKTITRLDEGALFIETVNYADTLVYYTIEADLDKGEYEVDAVIGQNKLPGTEKTTSMFARFEKPGYKKIAAVNGDLFNVKTGEPENNMMAGGRFLKASRLTDSPYDVFDNTHSQFAFTYDEKPVIGRFYYDGYATTPSGDLVTIDRVNYIPDSNSVVIWNEFQGKELPEINKEWSKFYIRLQKVNSDLDTIRAVITGMPVEADSLGSDDLVIGGFNDGRFKINRQMKPGDTLTIYLQERPLRDDFVTLVGGWPQIVRDSVNIAAYADSLEGTFPKFSAARHPRSGIGYSEEYNKLFLFTVDGRQKHSRGMSLSEFADMMLKAGVEQGMNFDGGGSSAMVVEGDLVNRPSDKNGERPVGNCVILCRKLPGR